MVSDAQRVRHDSQGWVHCPAGREEAAVNDIKIIKLMRLTVWVQHRSLGVAAHPTGAVLVGHASEWDAPGNVGSQGHEMIVTADVFEHVLELCLETCVRFL